MAKAEWRSFEACCAHCGSGAEVYTTTGKDNWAYDGDEARCTDCGCPGFVNVSGYEDEPATIDWHDEPNCDCDWCKANPA